MRFVKRKTARFDPAIPDQSVIDSCIATTHAKKALTPSQIAALESLIERVVPDGDVWNSDWPGFRATCQIGMGVQLREVIRSVREDYGETGEDGSNIEEAVEVFRSVIQEKLEGGGLGFFCRKIRATDGNEAWICFCLNDAPEYTIEDLYCTPLDAENGLRAQGWVFPSKEEAPPSGDQDEWSDEMVLHMLRRIVRHKGKGE